MSWIETRSLFLIFSGLSILGCGQPTDRGNISTPVRKPNPVGYDLSNPDKVLFLPPILSEISGITNIDSSKVACVQDENGIVFIFDMAKNEISDQFTFHYPGDYEGIAKVSGAFYVLRSDGVLFETGNDKSSASAQQIPSTAGISADYEGLCYDWRNQRLLIVPKNNPDRGPGYEKKHPVYALDLQNDKDAATEAFELDLPEITRYAAENNIKVSDEDKVTSLMVSDIGVHPLTNMLYVISAVNRMLFVFDDDRSITYMEELRPDLFSMPEGISFLDNGDMLISNEGRTNPASIMLFRYRIK